MDAQALHHRARTTGVNPIVYRLARLLLIPFFRLYFRMERCGREHIPAEGPLLLAANHRSFLDPFVLGTMTKRPLYYVAKKELFSNRLYGWVLNALGAFPVDRGASDQEMLDTARAILACGDAVLIFPEGTRIRPGGLATPKRGIGRLALETGAPVVPLALNGTEDVRKGWRIRPRKVRVRAGRPLTFPTVESPSRQLAQAVIDRIWPCVALQWEWLGGMSPLRRATVIGAGSWGTALAVALTRAGLEVQLGTRTAESAAQLTGANENPRYLPGVALDGIEVARAADLDMGQSDVVFLAVPSRDLAHALAAHGERIPRGAGVVVLSKGLVGPLGTLPCAFAAEAGHGAADCLEPGARERGDELGAERRGHRRGPRVRRGRGPRAPRGRAPRDVQRAGRHRRPRRHRRRPAEPQPPRRRAARRGRAAARDRADARPGRRGARHAAAAGRPPARRARRAPRRRRPGAPGHRRGERERLARDPDHPGRRIRAAA